MGQTCVLSIATSNAVGLLAEASQLIFDHEGFILHSTVRVFGNQAFLLLHFESEPHQLEKMQNAVRERTALATMNNVNLFLTAASTAAPGPHATLKVFSDDIRGLLAQQTGVIREHGLDILAHDGELMPSTEDPPPPPEYVQTIRLRTSQLNELVIPKGGPSDESGGHRPFAIRRWDLFRAAFQRVLDAQRGRFHLEGG